MIELGRVNKLEIVKSVDFGLYLSEEGSEEEILLPTRYVADNYEIGDLLDVFIYMDSEDRIIATTENPKAMVGEIVVLDVVQNTNVGAFLDWGLPKDLLLPFREQLHPVNEGDRVPVYVYLDQSSNRIAASSRLNKRLEDKGEFETGQEVDLIIYDKNEFGYTVVIDGSYRGMLYQKDLFKDITIGYESKGFISKIREDGRIDVSLRRFGFAKVLDESENILRLLEESGGFLKVTDKSSPELISSFFGISKNVYKKAVGKLYKAGKIDFEDEGIRLRNLD